MHSVTAAHARTPRPRTPWRFRSAIATLAIACAMLLGNAAAVADTLVSNLGQTAGAGTDPLNNNDMAQSFRTGTSATGYMLEGVSLKFATAPASTDTITAIVTDGLGASANTVATLTPPATWSTTSTFRAPANIVLAGSTTYHVIFEAAGTGVTVTTSQISRTTSSAEDTGGFSGWTIGNTYSRRGRTLGEGVGGTWNSRPQSINIAVLGEIVPIKVTSVAITSTRPTTPGVGIVPYAIGDAITFTVTFSSAVDVKPIPSSQGEGRPWLFFQMGTTRTLGGWSNKTSTCDLVTNATQMTCRYTVAEGDEDTDGISLEANALRAVGAKIYAAGTAVLIDPDHRVDSPAVAKQLNQPVDGVKPQLINTLARPAVTALDGTKIHLITTEPVASCDPGKFRVTANGTSNLVASCNTGTAGVPEDKVQLILDDTLSPNDTVRISIDANAFLDSSSNGNLAIATQNVRSAKLRVVVQNVSIMRGATDGNNYRSPVSWSTWDGVPIREDYEISFTWNGENLSNLHPDNPDTITFGPNTLDGNGEPVRASIWVRAAADDNTDYDSAVTAKVVGTVGTFTASDDLKVFDDDGLPTASLSVPETAVEGTNFKVTAALSHTIDYDATVYITHTNPYDIDLEGVPTTIRVPAGSLTGESAAMRKRDDSDQDGWGDVHFKINRTPYLPADDGTVTVRINDNDGSPADRRRYLNDGKPTGNALNTVGHESGTGARSTARFRVKVEDAKPGETYTFDYKTQDGNGGGDGPRATEDTDYVAKQGTLTFAPGETEKYVDVTILDDTHHDTNEAFLLVLSNPSSNAQLSPRSNGRCTILNHDPERVAASFPTSTSSSSSHTGSNDRPEVVIAFSQPVSSIDADSDSIEITGATLESHAAHTESGIDHGWRFTLAPTDFGDVTFALKTGVACAGGGICTDAGHALTNVPAARTIAGPTGLVGQLANLPAENPGEDFTIDLTFSQELNAGWRQIMNAFITDGASINRVTRKRRGSDLGWNIKVRPSGTGEISLTLVAPSVACSAGGAICTENGAEKLSNRPSATIPAAGGADTTPAASIADAAGTEGTDTSVEFTVTLDKAATGTVTVDYATADGTATAGTDYTATSGSLSFVAGVTSQTISVPITEDTETESAETFTVALSNASGATLGTSTATGTITDTATIPSANIADATATEGTDSSLSFTVTLDAAPTDTVTIDYATSDGTATADADYTSTTGTLTFADGATSGTISVPIADDALNESNETLTVTLSNAEGATLATASATGTIVNRAIVLPSASIASAGDATEGTDTSVTFMVALDKAGTGTVTLDYASADGTATAGSDYTAASGTLTFPPGVTGQQISIAIADDSVNEPDETITVTLSNPSGATLGTASASGTIINRYVAPPLTASFANMPAEHGGSGQANQFSFDLSFSENVKTGWRKLKDRAFTVTGGHIEKVRRKTRGDGSKNQHWTIFVQPAGFGDVVISLPGGRACGAANAICTFDAPERPISSTVTATVAGPAALSVADASANENSDTGLEFPVTLGRASTLTVTVAYATSDGTATAGQDYTATSGTLTFNPGDTAKTVTVPVLNDVIDDGGETVTLTLSNATNAAIADATAIGTIENSDPLQREWIARFARTVASDVVDGITDRLANRGGTSEVRIAGVTLQHSGDTWTEALSEDTEITDPLQEPQRAANRQLSPHELLTQSAFRLQGESGGPESATWGAWGHFATSSFDGEAESLSFSGDVITGMLGADVGTDDWTAGLALSSAKGDGPYQMDDRNSNGCMSGTVDSTLTSVHPYAEVQLNRAVSLWGIAGHGTGDMTIDQHGDTDCAATYKTDVDMTMAAAGLRGQMLEAAAGDALDMAVRTDALWLRTTSDKTVDLAAADARVTRLRLMVDASRSLTVDGNATLTPSIEVGLRHDGGDAEEGVGLEVGAGLAFRRPGIAIEGKVRTLVAHDDDAYREWGASAAVRIDPGSDGRGMSLTITPTWGSAATEAEQLWSTRTAEDLVSDNTFEADRRIDAELGYGVGGPYGWGTLTPFGGLSLSDGAQRTLRTGLRWNASESATVALEGTREENGDGETPANALMLRAQVRF